MSITAAGGPLLAGTPVHRRCEDSTLDVYAKSPVGLGYRRVGIVLSDDRGVERKGSIRSQDASNANVGEVIVIHSRKHVVGFAALKIEVEGPDLHRLRLESEDERVGAVIKCLDLRARWSSDGDVVEANFDVTIGVTVAGVNRKPAAYIKVGFDRV